MATKAQTEANRRNAQKATGPRTDAGKAKIRQNALRHGLCAGMPLMSDETEEEMNKLLDTLREEHEPVGATEEILVYKMAEHFFYCKRASYLLTEQCDWADKGETNAREIALMLRYHTTADRGFYKALSELRKLQQERRLQEIGFESQNLETTPEPATPELVAEAPSSPAPPRQPAQTPVQTPAKAAKPALSELDFLINAYMCDGKTEFLNREKKKAA